MTWYDAIDAVRRFLGLGKERIVDIPVPDSSLVKQPEFCVSIDLRTFVIQPYHYSEGDCTLVPRWLDHAVGLTSSGSIWVHSYVSLEQASILAKQYAHEFWNNDSFTSVYYLPWDHVVRRHWQQTARDKDSIRKGYI